MLEENDRHLTLDDYEDPTSNLPLTQSDAVMALAAATSDLARAVSKISYVPTVWVDNNEPDINAANLNKIEQGILQATTAINGAVDAINRNASAIAAINGNLGNGEFVSTSILQKAEELPAGCYIFRLSGASYSGNDLPPNDTYKYGVCTIYKRNNTSVIIALYGESAPLAVNRRTSSWNGWQIYVTNTDLGIVYHPNIAIPSTKTSIESWIKSNIGTLNRFNVVRSNPPSGSEAGIFPGNTSFCILWQCSSPAYGWITLYSDNISRPIVYGVMNSAITWSVPTLTQI